MEIHQKFVILFFGKTGVGKSSTLNKLFNLSWNTDNAVACTKFPQWVRLNSFHFPEVQDTFKNKDVYVVDMPGIGESLSDDAKYTPFYEEWIPQIDSLVWVTQADTRAYKRDQIFMQNLLPLFKSDLHLTIALNKIDYLGVDDGMYGFDFKKNSPSEEQLNVLPLKINDVYEVFSEIIGDAVPFCKDQVVPYTSEYNWGLINLKDKIISRS